LRTHICLLVCVIGFGSFELGESVPLFCPTVKGKHFNSSEWIKNTAAIYAELRKKKIRRIFPPDLVI